MIKIDDAGLWKADVGQEIRRLERLLFDLNLIHSGGGYPPANELAAAPLVRAPRIVPISVPALAGLFADRDQATTGVIKVIAQDGSWVRAADRLYRVEIRQ